MTYVALVLLTDVVFPLLKVTWLVRHNMLLLKTCWTCLITYFSVISRRICSMILPVKEVRLDSEILFVESCLEIQFFLSCVLTSISGFYYFCMWAHMRSSVPSILQSRLNYRGQIRLYPIRVWNISLVSSVTLLFVSQISVTVFNADTFIKKYAKPFNF